MLNELNISVRGRKGIVQIERTDHRLGRFFIKFESYHRITDQEGKVEEVFYALPVACWVNNDLE